MLFMEGSNPNSKAFLNIIKHQIDSHPRTTFEYPDFQIKSLPEYQLLDNGNNIIGYGLQLQVQKKENGKLTTISGGKVIFIPPPFDSSIEDAIDLLLEDLGLAKSEEILPDWIN